MIPTRRSPSLPGEILQKDFIEPHRMTQAQLARRTGLSVQTINLIVNGRRNITAETALLFAKVFKTTPMFWMTLQNKVDLWQAAHKRRP